MRYFRKQFLRTFSLLSGIFLGQFAFAQDSVTNLISGLSVSYATAGEADVAAAPNIWLYVPAGKSPTPFLPGEKFTATWEGFLSAELRGDYAFQTELNGHLRLEINGTNVMDTAGTNSISELSKSIRLRKGTNLVKGTFTSPAQGDAFVRLRWKRKGSLAQPIPSAALSHSPATLELTGNKLRLGRELFVEHHCAKCHTTPPSETAMPELGMDTPSLEEIGSRRNYDWMARWIADPKSLRASAHMPVVFSGESSKTNSQAVAAYLASLKSDLSSALSKEPSPEHGKAGKNLFTTLHCNVCHDEPDSAKTDANKVGLRNVREKFAPGTLSQFLKQPDLHYAWIRMPTFKLSDAQCQQLAAYLLSNSETPKEIVAPIEKTVIEAGKKLVQDSGCLNCHALKAENRFSTKSLAELSNVKLGCLAENLIENSKAPHFKFSAEQREALRMFVAIDRASLQRHAPAEFAERQSRILNCAECHTKIEGIPRFEILGGKLKPEWAAKFIAGEINYKPRPWVAAQMPAFSKRAQLLAEGLAMQHGISAHTEIEQALDTDAIEAGRKLVSSPPLGFSCVSCHAIGKDGAAQVFESPGINLMHSGERLLPGFFHRWMLSPSSIDPITKMPTYFDDEGNSPLADIYNGDGAKQINAMWEYIRLGEKMPAPTIE